MDPTEGARRRNESLKPCARGQLILQGRFDVHLDIDVCSNAESADFSIELGHQIEVLSAQACRRMETNSSATARVDCRASEPRLNPHLSRHVANGQLPINVPGAVAVVGGEATSISHGRERLDVEEPCAAQILIAPLKVRIDTLSIDRELDLCTAGIFLHRNDSTESCEASTYLTDPKMPRAEAQECVHWINFVYPRAGNQSGINRVNCGITCRLFCLHALPSLDGPGHKYSKYSKYV